MTTATEREESTARTEVEKPKTNEDGTPIKPGKERDHAGISESREKEAANAEAVKEKNRERRKKMRAGGTLDGVWFPAGNSLVNMQHVFKITLPAEGDTTPTVTLQSLGGSSVTLTGEEAAEFMEENGLEPLAALATADNNTVTEGGRIVSPRDAAAELIPGRENRVPNHSHRANAILTNAETDAEVQARAGSNPIPPTRDTLAPVTTPAVPVAGEDDEDATGTDSEGKAKAKAAPKTGSKASKRGH